MLGFESLKFPDQAIVFRVRHFRIVEYVIAIVVMANLLTERFGFLSGRS